MYPPLVAKSRASKKERYDGACRPNRLFLCLRHLHNREVAYGAAPALVLEAHARLRTLLGGSYPVRRTRGTALYKQYIEMCNQIRRMSFCG